MENRRLDGGTEWLTFEGELHREYDLPAIMWADGSKEWWVFGRRHREGDLPAIERADGTKEWWVFGRRHREGDMPAIMFTNGDAVWWVHDLVHRGGDLPAVIFANGNKSWWTYDQRHRVGAPAIERHDTPSSYWIYGCQVDGPRWFIRGGWRDRNWCATLIQSWWRDVIIDSQYAIARRRLQKRFEELVML